MNPRKSNMLILSETLQQAHIFITEFNIDIESVNLKRITNIEDLRGVDNCIIVRLPNWKNSMAASYSRKMQLEILKMVRIKDTIRVYEVKVL